jgi:RecA-family ATPase
MGLGEDFRAARAAEGGRGMTDPKADTEFLCAAELHGRSVPERRWIVRGYIPDQTVTILAGDGATGKSIIGLQLGIAVARETEWIGLPVVGGTALFVSAEDDMGEVHRRLAAICDRRGVSLADLGDLHIWDRAGRDAVLARYDPRAMAMTPTELWGRLSDHIRILRPNIVIIDTLADVFGGDENNRGQTRAFINMLRGLAIEFELAVLLLSHPSVAGMQSGSGTSGSTAWSNSVRSRLYLEIPKAKGVAADRLARVLTTKKANYAAIGREIRLRWQEGAYEPETEHPAVERTAANKAAEDAFLELLATFEKQGRTVSSKPSPSYAPKVFADHPDANGFTKRALANAMERLLKLNRITVEQFGPLSKQRSKLTTVALQLPMAAE